MAAIARRSLAAWLRARSGARDAHIAALEPMSGGALQENWLVILECEGGVLAGRSELVLRTDAVAPLAQSHSRHQEFALLSAARRAGVTVPEPLFDDLAGAAIGRPAFLMRRVSGMTAARALVRNPPYEAQRRGLTRQLGAEIARLHRIIPGDTLPGNEALSFLGPPPRVPVARRIADCQAQLDALPQAHPVLEWGLSRLARMAPPPDRITLCHGDYRTGNIMIDGDRITGILDWELASWGDPMEDIGWLCARCWRHGIDTREVGGLGARADLYAGYEAQAGHSVDWGDIPFWEALATARWAIIAHHQGRRHLAGGEPALQLALTGRKAVEIEYELLTLVDRLEGRLESRRESQLGDKP